MNIVFIKSTARYVGTLFLLGALCLGTFSAQAAQIVDRIVAVVNEDIILLSDLNQRLKPYTDRIDSAGYSEEQRKQMTYKVREDMINRMIEEKLTDQEISRLQIEVTDEEINKTLERIKEVNYYTDQDLRDALQREGLTMEAYRKDLKEQLLRTKLVNEQVRSKIVITNADVQAYYENHRAQYKGETRVHLRNILMKLPPNPDAQEAEAVRQRMQQVLDRLKQGESFADLAERYSESPVASEGGDLGEFSLNTLAPEIKSAVAELSAGGVTPILETDQGLQVFQVEKVSHTGGKSLAEATPEIQDKLFNEIVNKRFQSWLEDLRSRSHIKIIK